MKFAKNSKLAVALLLQILPRLVLLLSGFLSVSAVMSAEDEIDYGLTRSAEVIQTSEAGDRLTQKENIEFRAGPAGSANVIRVDPGQIKQTLTGIGTSFTESSAFVLAHLDTESRNEVMRNIYSEQGANFSLTRTPIGATDFSVDGRYSYADTEGDKKLEHFSISVDSDGFERKKYPGIKDEKFDLLPMIQQALQIKEQQQDSAFNIIASAWTAPAWMKDIEDWYQPGNADNNYNGSGGMLKPEYEKLYADYIIRYLDAYREQGVAMWGLTPVNEPLGNNGQWESMHFSAESQRDFIRDHLGPKLHSAGYKDLALLMLDHSRDHLEHWAEVIYGDAKTAAYVDGAAVHWYESTFKVYEDTFDRVHQEYPDFDIIHTEGCIDDLGKDAPAGVLDPEGYKESGWFDNDDFWWNANASDWAYSVTWAGVKAEDHPLYTPVHRYARNIIVSLNHWVSGWIDWNIVLDANGGPNHVGNFCGAPIMIDTATGYVYYTPIYYILTQFSKTIRPGDQALQADRLSSDLDSDTLHASASIGADDVISVQVLNTSKQAVEYAIQIGAQHARVTIAANALQTVRVRLP